MSDTVVNLGTGGSVLDGTLGSTSSPDSNDPMFLSHPADNNGNYIYLSGVASNVLSVPDEAALDITGDIDIRFRVSADDWTPTANMIPIAKYGSAGNRSWFVRLTTSGTITFTWSEDGTAVIAKNNATAVGLADGTTKWVRVTLDVDNGSSQNEVKFFTSDDGTSWTQLGTTVTTAGVTSIFNSTASVFVGSSTTTAEPFAGKVLQAQIFNGIDGTKVLDVDTSVITTGSQTTFTALTGQTVTIGTSTSGKKTVRVVSPLWLFGTDDYIEVADNSLIDFAGSDSFSIVSVYRQWANFGTNDTLVAKKSDTTNTTQGYYLGSGASTAAETQAQIGDGVAGITATQTTSRTSGTLYVSTLVRNVATDNATLYLNTSAGSAVVDTTTGSLSNTEVLRIGRLSGAGTEYSDMELVAVAVFRRALSATEVSNIVACYQERLS